MIDTNLQDQIQDHSGAVVAEIIEIAREHGVSQGERIDDMEPLINAERREQISAEDRIKAVIGLLSVTSDIFVRASDKDSDFELPDTMRSTNLFTFLNVGCHVLESLPPSEIALAPSHEEFKRVVGDKFKEILFGASEVFTQVGGASKLRDLVFYWQKYDRISEEVRESKQASLDTPSGVGKQTGTAAFGAEPPPWYRSPKSSS